MTVWDVPLTFSSGFFLLLALALALSFEFVNGFHDTANAVATVIYTKTLKPIYAVVWSGFWNLFGALFAIFVMHGLVAYTVVSLLPSDILAGHIGAVGFAMVFSVLISAIIWNLGTWYLGLPASSSHTLIGAIMGVGIGNAVMAGRPWIEGLNVGKVESVGLALLVSPLIGFFASALLLLLMKVLIPWKVLFVAPEPGATPPLWIRGILMLTCTGVSFSHGSNDAQKGMGLIMVILFGILPGAFLLNMNASPGNIADLTKNTQALVDYAQPLAGTEMIGSTKEAGGELKAFKKAGALTPRTYAALVTDGGDILNKIGSNTSFTAVPAADRVAIKADLVQISDALTKMVATHQITSDQDVKTAKAFQKSADSTTKYIPWWVAILVALALGFGTMIGWKRIVVTVGEKIGKAHLTYGQGAAAEFTAMCTVFAADNYGAPVSTTHVLSSGIAGTMAANGSGLQTKTLINILLAWVLTLPVCVFLGASIFSFILVVVFKALQIQ